MFLKLISSAPCIDRLNIRLIKKNPNTYFNHFNLKYSIQLQFPKSTLNMISPTNIIIISNFFEIFEKCAKLSRNDHEDKQYL